MAANMEFDTIVLPLDDKVQEQIQNLAHSGWMLVPGVRPLGIWQVCRPQGFVVANAAMMENTQVKATFEIDSSKVGVLRNGRFVDEAGNEVPPPQ